MSSTKHFCRPVSWALCALAALATGALSACQALPAAQNSPGQPQSLSGTSQAWAGEIEELLASAQGQPQEAYLRQVFADHSVSEAEIQETEARVLQCVRDAGFENFRFLGGDLGSESYGVEGDPDGSKARAAADKCEETHGYPAISGVYSSMKINPSRANWDELIVACLTRNKVVEPSYSADDFQREFHGYLDAHADSEGLVDGDPRYAVTYSVDPEIGVETLSQCQSNPSFNGK